MSTEVASRKRLRKGDVSSPRVCLAPSIGRLAGMNRNGEILVEYDASSPKAARLIEGLNRKELARRENLEREVLLVFEEGDPNRPIVVGLMEDAEESRVAMEIINADAPRPLETRVDGKQVKIEAQEEITLQCGRGSITIRKDGKIVIKGTHLLSRSSGPLRIKGARVDIN